MSFIRNRLRRLEDDAVVPCPGCGHTPNGRRPIAALYPDDADKGFEGDPHEACRVCGEPLYTVFRVVYDEPRDYEEGGGAYR